MDVKDGVKRVVQDIYDRYGFVQASTLVDAARPEDSPAHNGFEWNDDKAAEEYRLIQARQWIRIVRVEVNEQEERLVHVPVIVKADTKEGFYKPVSVVVESGDEFNAAYAEALGRLKAAKDALSELANAAERDKEMREAAPQFREIANSVSDASVRLEAVGH